MSTEDIKLMITADEARAVAALAKLEKTTKSAELALAAIDEESRNIAQSFEDLSRYTGSGGPFDQIKQDSGELKAILSQLGDINWSDIVSKVREVWNVSYQVGDTIGRWAFGVDEFNAKFEESKQIAQQFHEAVTKSAVERAATIGLEQIQKEIDGYSAAIARLTEQQRKLNEEQYRFELAADKEAVATAIRQQQELRDALIQVQEARKREAPQPQNENQQLMQTMGFRNEQEAQAYRDALYAAEVYTEQMAREQAERERLAAAQENYLQTLDAELVRLKEGEEAYLRLTMAKQGFTEETIESALQIRNEIEQLRELDRDKTQRPETAKDVGVKVKATLPGVVQGTEARGLTRGVGIRGQDKILAATQKQVDLQDKIAKQLEEQNRILKERLPREVG